MPTDDRPPREAPSTLIALPGTGSDDDYVRRAFGPAAARLGVELIAPAPTADLVAGHRRALDAASDRHRRVLVGGVSIGAAIAVEWALTAGPQRCAGVWAALPGWSGSPDGSLAAASARATAHALADDGLDATVDAMVASSPGWLADELSRSWRHLYPALIRQLTDAARYRAPELAAIATLRVPLAVVAATDDPLHPIAVARAWCAAAPRSALREVTLTGWGTDAALLGRSCADGWLALTAR
ncbi:alpha/beta hydrolase [Gordonia sinesedis]